MQLLCNENIIKAINYGQLTSKNKTPYMIFLSYMSHYIDHDKYYIDRVTGVLWLIFYLIN